jgi:hypothetical protein
MAGCPLFTKQTEVIAMDKKLAQIVNKIGDDYKDNISKGSRFYLEVNIGEQAVKYGHSELGRKYDGKYAIVPLKRPLSGMKVRIDGRTFVNYAQFKSGVVVPNFIARDAGLSYKTFIPHDSMVCNFA